MGNSIDDNAFSFRSNLLFFLPKDINKFYDTVNPTNYNWIAWQRSPPKNKWDTKGCKWEWILRIEKRKKPQGNIENFDCELFLFGELQLGMDPKRRLRQQRGRRRQQLLPFLFVFVSGNRWECEIFVFRNMPPLMKRRPYPSNVTLNVPFKVTLTSLLCGQTQFLVAF